MFCENVSVDGQTVPRFKLDVPLHNNVAVNKEEAEKKKAKETQTFNDALKKFFDHALQPGMACGARVCMPPQDGTLVYQDGTACSASYAMSDVFCMPDNTFIVQTEVGQAHFTGDDPSNHVTYHVRACAGLLDVVVELACFCGHDPNSTGEMLHQLGGLLQQGESCFDENWIRGLAQKPEVVSKLYALATPGMSPEKNT